MNRTSVITTVCWWTSGMQVNKELQFLIDLHTGRQLSQSDYTRSCIHTIVLLKMSRELLETCRGFK